MWIHLNMLMTCERILKVSYFHVVQSII
uniref:Uncharacterized protein n=1 Tax=Anguilla anguilla TaxID=7936 RepID=A0A0E9RNK6_ANGAN